MWVAFTLQKLLAFFHKKFQHICVSLDVNFNESLTNDVVSFEKLVPDQSSCCLHEEMLHPWLSRMHSVNILNFWLDCKCADWSESLLGAQVWRYIYTHGFYPRHTIVVGYYGIPSNVCPSACPNVCLSFHLSVHTSALSFWITPTVFIGAHWNLVAAYTMMWYS